MWALRAMCLVRVCVAGLVVSALAGCGLPDGLTAVAGVGVAAGVGVISVATIGRSPVDAVYSLASGRDCSVVRLDEGKSYCRPVDPPPETQAFCTRSLGVANCWADPAGLEGHPRSVADAPAMTAEQEAYRVRRWPWW
jgi:hypothetical protein